MVDRDQLLTDLARLGDKHADYYGTVERFGRDTFRLRYYRESNERLIEDQRIAWNDGVRALDEIAPRILRTLGYHNRFPTQGETAGATVMAWVLRDKWPANRVSSSAKSNAFEAIREALLGLEVDRDFVDVRIDLEANTGEQNSNECSQSPSRTSVEGGDDLHGPASTEIDQLERETPGLDAESVDWVRSDKIDRKKSKIPSIRTLAKYRTAKAGGRQTADKMFGIDCNGRIWRRSGTPNSMCYYLRSTLVPHVSKRRSKP